MFNYIDDLVLPKLEADFPHTVYRWLTPRDSRAAVYAWCVENIGPQQMIDWCHIGSQFWFRTATEATAFKIRWC